MKSWEITKRAMSVLLSLSIAVLLCGCSGRRIKRNYTESEFCAEIRWEREGESFSAKLWADASSSEGQDRKITLEFISPEELQGISAESFGEKDFIVCGEVRTELHNSAILDAAHLIADIGSFSVRGSTSVAGRELVLVERLCGNTVTRIYIDGDSGAPFRAVSDSLTVDVVWFEYIS